MPEKPRILHETIIAQSRLFTIQSLHLRFSNGQERVFERMKSQNHAAVLIIPLHEDTFFLVREYCAGVDEYQLAFPKGVVDAGESLFEAANRELQEEVGFKANTLTHLRSVSLAPGYLSHQTQLVLAQDLIPQTLPGDEPEPLEVVPWKLTDIDALLQRPDFTEARSIAALWLLEKHLRHRGQL